MEVSTRLYMKVNQGRWAFNRLGFPVRPAGESPASPGGLRPLSRGLAADGRWTTLADYRRYRPQKAKTRMGSSAYYPGETGAYQLEQAFLHRDRRIRPRFAPRPCGTIVGITTSISTRAMARSGKLTAEPFQRLRCSRIQASGRISRGVARRRLFWGRIRVRSAAISGVLVAIGRRQVGAARRGFVAVDR
jgi:hypothetical protein